MILKSNAVYVHLYDIPHSNLVHENKNKALRTEYKMNVRALHILYNFYVVHHMRAYELVHGMRWQLVLAQIGAPNGGVAPSRG